MLIVVMEWFVWAFLRSAEELVSEVEQELSFQLV
jgi:hypothetical protein